MLSDEIYQSATIESDGNEIVTTSGETNKIELTTEESSSIVVEVEETYATLSVSELNVNENLMSATLGINENLEGFLSYYKGDTGLSAFEEWLTISGNEGKTFDDFLADIGNSIDLNLDVTYIRTEGSRADVGGVKKGHTFSGTVQDALDAIFYPAIDPTFKLTASPSGQLEIGEVIQEVTFSLDINYGSYEVETIEIFQDGNSIFVSHIDVNSTIFTTYLHKNSTFKGKLVYKSDILSNEIYSNEVKITFLPKIYWGTLEKPLIYDSEFVLNLENSALDDDKAREITVNAGTTEYIYYVLPTSYGTPIFVVNGFEGGFSLEKTLSFVNEKGYTQNYDIWKSNHKNLGSLTITIK